MSVRVDPEMLRAFSDSVAGVARSIATTDVSTPYADVQNALPGTGFDALVQRGYDSTSDAMKNVCTRLAEISRIAKGNADDYEVAEDEFTGRLHKMDVPQ